ncbi:hypothetical protein SDC9_30505 [bioreactor metagenome]|uniref:Uncharacterized protein n=1 Tax=bioreactor metagenome TaxID=1076179 RepID=A0A644UZP0_9ZZZZ|nr:hypothetical protein [Methanobrevibacter sp.]MEA4957562.1 hypothetical protein [Methanobrevibacter sp.]
MLISELIKELDKNLSEHGDIEVILEHDNEFTNFSCIGTIEIFKPLLESTHYVVLKL